MSELSDLFRWKREVDIVNIAGEKLAKVYLRIIGDNEYQEARGIGLKASRVLRVKLRDDKSNEYGINFDDIDSLIKDELVNIILVAEIIDYREEGLASIGEEKVLPLSDNPTLEEQEEHQSKTEKIKENRTDKLRTFMEKKSEERKEELLKLHINELKNLYKTSVINMRCQEEFATLFREFSVYSGAYSNKKHTKLAFDSFDDFKSSPTQLKMQVMGAYTELELSGEQLKN